MNKKSLRIAGWAIGLSLALGGVGAAVGASQAAPIEAQAAETPNSTQTLVITRDSFSSTGGYNWYNWSESTSGGTTISGKAEIYATTDDSMQFNKNKGNGVAAIFNTVALPGAITKIEATTASGTNRTWNAYVSSGAYSASGSTLTAGANSTRIGNAISVTTSSTSLGTSDHGYSFFCLQENVQSASYLAEIKITYFVPAVVDDWELTTGSLSVSTAPDNLLYYSDDSDTNIDKAGAVIQANYWSASKHSTTKQEEVTDDVEWHLDLPNNRINLSYTDSASHTQTGSISITVDPGTRPLFVSWDLSKKTYSTGDDYVTWSSSAVEVTNSSASGGTIATNYLGGDANNRTSSRFYSGNTLTITPEAGFVLSSVVFTATSDSYATALKNSTWTNASSSASASTVTVTPSDGKSVISASIGGTCGFTAIRVNYGKTWSKSFLDRFTCSGVTPSNPSGAITATNPASLWAEMGTSFNDLDPTVRSSLKTLPANVGGSIDAQAMARYDLIIRKYGKAAYSDFIGRFDKDGANPSGSMNAFGFGAGNQNSLPEIISVVAVGLAAAGGLVFLHHRHRKED